MKESIYAAPQSELTHIESSGVYRYKRYAIMNPDAAWPDRCFKCNADCASHKNVKVVYVNPWIYITLLITPLVTIVLALIFQKKFSLNLPMCDLHLKRRRNFVVFQWVALALMISGIVIGAVIGSELIIALSIFLLFIVLISAIAGRMIHVGKFKDNRLWIRGTGKAFLQSLPTFKP